jgi:hypothetical protein
MVDGQDFFLKPLRTFLEKGLLNEPNFGQIHLAGQYLSGYFSDRGRKVFPSSSNLQGKY